MARWGLSLVILLVSGLGLVACDRVYLSADVATNWDGVCSGCGAANPCGMAHSNIYLASTCELVIVPASEQPNYVWIIYNGPEGFNVTSLGQTVTWTRNNMFMANGGPLRIYDFVLVLDSTFSDLGMVSAEVEMTNSIVSRKVEPQENTRLTRFDLVGPINVLFHNTTLKEDVPSSTGRSSLVRIPASTSVTFRNSVAFTGGDILEVLAEDSDLTVINSNVTGALSRNSSPVPRNVRIEDSIWTNAPLTRFSPYGPSGSFSIVRSTLDCPLSNTQDQWASTGVINNFEIINSSVLNMPLLFNPITLHIESSIVEHNQQKPLINASSSSFTVNNTVFRRTFASGTHSDNAIQITAASASLSLSWQNSTVQETSPAPPVLRLPENVQIISSSALPSLHAVDSTWDITVPSLHISNPINAYDDEEGAHITFSGTSLILDSIEAIDTGFASDADVEVTYHVTNITNGCFRLIDGPATGGRPYLVSIGSRELQVDLSQYLEEFNTEATAPQYGDEYPLFNSQMARLTLTELSGTFNLRYALSLVHGSVFNFGAVTCNSSCAIDHLAGPCAHPTFCKCSAAWSGPLCDCPTSLWIGGVCTENPEGPMQNSEEPPFSEPTTSPTSPSHSLSIGALCIFWSMLAILIFSI